MVHCIYLYLVDPFKLRQMLQDQPGQDAGLGSSGLEERHFFRIDPLLIHRTLINARDHDVFQPVGHVHLHTGRRLQRDPVGPLAI